MTKLPPKPRISLPASTMMKEFAVAVTKQPKTMQTKDAKPTRLTPYLSTNNPAGKLRKTPGTRTMDMSNPASV